MSGDENDRAVIRRRTDSAVVFVRGGDVNREERSRYRGDILSRVSRGTGAAIFYWRKLQRAG